MKAKIIRIEIRSGENGLLFATSPDLPGLHISDTDEDAILADIPVVIQALLEVRGIKVKVIESEDNDQTGLPPWIALPVPDTEESASDLDHR